MTEDGYPIALVTGGGQGIGAGVSSTLADAGYHVVINDLDEVRAAAVVNSIAANGGRASYQLADVSDSSSIDAMFDRVEREFGSVSVLVNNAGVNGNAGIRNVTDAVWDRVMSIDLDGVLHCTRRALGPMRDAGAGSVINIASRAWLGWWGQSAYASAKAGVVGMTRALAIEMASKGVRLNVVAPGLIDSPMLRNRDEGAFQRLLTSVPSGILGTPRDIANAVLFLAGERSRTITGQVLYVCGGKSIYAYPDWT